MFCQECGYRNAATAHYCAKCGTLLDADAADDTATYQGDSDTQDIPVGAGHQLPAVVIRTGGRAGEHIALTQPRETIGRAGEASILLDDVTVSRRHAAIEEEADGRYLVDLASLNGTYVNHRRIERARLRDGDEVQIGKFKLTYLE
ncbi:MAG: FHA domain-containing protein [Actinobacteria bacterium]|nr:FHA domain-containing protein [Actinomycetota bacterium]